MSRNKYIVFGQGPNEPQKEFSITVEASSERQAKDYIRLIHNLGSQPLKAFPTTMDCIYIATNKEITQMRKNRN